MFKNRLNNLNLFLFIFLVIICTIFYIKLNKDRHFEKVIWQYSILTSPSNQHYKILDFALKNDFKESSNFYSLDAPANNLLTGKDDYSLYSGYLPDRPDLLPNQLEMSWFCYEDQSFYKINEKLPYELIRNKAMKISHYKSVITEISPNGKIAIYLEPDISTKDFRKMKIRSPIITFQAKKFPVNWELLKHQDSRFEETKTFPDYLIMFKENFLWGIVTELPENSRLVTYFAEDFYDDSFAIPELEGNKMNPKKKFFPAKIQVQWIENNSSYRCDFFADATDLLSAYKTLKKSATINEYYFLIRANKTEDRFEIYLQNGTEKILLKNNSTYGIQEN